MTDTVSWLIRKYFLHSNICRFQCVDIFCPIVTLTSDTRLRLTHAYIRWFEASFFQVLLCYEVRDLAALHDHHIHSSKPLAGSPQPVVSVALAMVEQSVSQHWQWYTIGSCISRLGARSTNGISIEFGQNLECSCLKCAAPITTKFCIRHVSYTLMTCAKLRCDRQSIFYARARQIWSNFENDRNIVSGTAARQTIKKYTQNEYTIDDDWT